MSLGLARKIFREGLWEGNQVFVQVLGICSTLAVTAVLKNTLVMCAGLVYVTAMSNLTVSLLRKVMPGRVRMMTEVLVIAFWVMFVDLALKALAPSMSRQLGPYVGLIITNCIVMGRTEAFALSNPPALSFVDGLSAGLGYSWVLVVIAFVRELLGSGSVFGVRVLGPWWTNWSVMVMAPGAFFVLALFVWIVKGVFLRPKAAAGGGR